MVVVDGVLQDFVMPKGRGELPAITHDRAASSATKDVNSNFIFAIRISWWINQYSGDDVCDDLFADDFLKVSTVNLSTCKRGSQSRWEPNKELLKV